MLFPRTIRLDRSDLSVFPRAAEPGEWAVPGTFCFAHLDPESLGGKDAQAFRCGFFGTASHGWSTLVEVASIGPTERDQVVRALAGYFVEELGAPDVDSAIPAAEQEFEFASALCEFPEGTLLAMEREFDGLKIVERFRSIEADDALGHGRMRLWGWVADED